MQMSRMRPAQSRGGNMKRYAGQFTDLAWLFHEIMSRAMIYAHTQVACIELVYHCVSVQVVQDTKRLQALVTELREALLESDHGRDSALKEKQQLEGDVKQMK
eukprot:scaffold160308_cov50-Prasinocladus_malaysianus.AAC.1